ncbi:hypothetical protein BV898_16440 [Hypsibius exemplaris]|uniref:G-protein coupled receptors family 1 profile domain-containing protein n=1 Tax=Hypsibius exemplaris TaxID=2072580 RepID=A0A9X6NFW5_HYPEX|nr:hypothetical protein BV898_16440 [Hypsibius exemplaris]
MNSNSSAPLITNLTLANQISPSEELKLTWSLTPVFFLCISILGLIFNAGALFLFIKKRHSSTPFDIYVINLLGVNIICLFTQYPLSVISNLYPYGWHLGGPACTLYMYCLAILNAGIIHIHALISINRAWAIVHPISFRTAHTNRTTVMICVIMWIYIHVAEGSYLLIDTLHYRLDVRSYGCRFNHNAHGAWANVADIVMFIVPLCGIVLSFPVVMASKAHRDRKRRTAPQRLSDRSTAANQGHVIPTEGTDGCPRSQTRIVIGNDTRQRKASNKYLVFTAMTASVIVCSAPDLIYYLLVGFVPKFWNHTFYQVAGLVYSCETVVDPILFVVALDKLRKTPVQQRPRP